MFVHVVSLMVMLDVPVLAITTADMLVQVVHAPVAHQPSVLSSPRAGTAPASSSFAVDGGGGAPQPSSAPPRFGLALRLRPHPESPASRFPLGASPHPPSRPWAAAAPLPRIPNPPAPAPAPAPNPPRPPLPGPESPRARASLHFSPSRGPATPNAAPGGAARGLIRMPDGAPGADGSCGVVWAGEVMERHR